ncbi:MAG: hypothetical protein LBC97_10745 [Bifidobacteriaceae bacterium]|jgi:hypothetical protein|nr:hypothetical protein [Bifidobacteriaceae bacterium]
MSRTKSYAEFFRRSLAGAVAFAAAGAGVALAASAASAEGASDTPCPVGLECLGPDYAVTRDLVLAEQWSLPRDTKLVVNAGVTLTLGPGASIASGAQIDNQGTIVVQTETELVPDIVNRGVLVVDDGATLVKNGNPLDNPGLIEVRVGGAISLLRGGIRSSGEIINQGTITLAGGFDGTEIPSTHVNDDDFVNDGLVDNREGHFYLRWSVIHGSGQWLGEAEHGPLFQVAVRATSDRTPLVEFLGLENCLPELTNRDELGEWANYQVIDEDIATVFVYSGFELTVAVAATCSEYESGAVYEYLGWGVGGEGAWPAMMHGGNPFTVVTFGQSVTVWAIYEVPTTESTTPPPTSSGPTPTTLPPTSSGPTLAPTGADFTRVGPEGRLALGLIAAGLAMVGLGAARRRTHNHQS